jgi:hypothetical protein
MSEPLSRREFTDAQKVAEEARKVIIDGMGKVLESQNKMENRVGVFFESYQHLKELVEGRDGNGGLKKKWRFWKEPTGEQSVHLQ